jgi:hypothetical protein
MSIRLRDLWAPAWSVTLTGQRYGMRPLSLRTFADLEGEGITLSSLSGKAPGTLWARLFMQLASLEPSQADEERILSALLQDPLALKKLQFELTNALSHKQQVQDNYRHRKVKNPLTEKKQETPEEPVPEELDVSFLLMVARLTGLSLDDISRMTFSGILALQEWLKENPPQPTGLFG